MKVSYCFFVAVLISAPTLAQDSISPCVLGCVTDAASSAGCTSFIDLDCVCANIDFQTTAATCLQEKCTADEQTAALSVQKQMCASAGATNGPAPTNLPGQPLSTTASALQVTTQAATGSSIVPIPTTLITTTDSAGNVFTVTGEVLVSGNSSTTVPCRTVITTNAAGVTVTSTETGSSVLPTELQGQNSSSQAVTASATASSSLMASPSIATFTAGAGMPNLSNAVLVSVVLSGISTMILVLLK
ncbi:hypothetical protein FOVG_16284 [Fusarium oxysporum f. sp. pisi HDV247]|uniref:CFEM domain-containing protein n=1 Tax=Fusarium oxysporum f. sp. pisi HDV247 TaxID=1080344 RepID=W9NI66_FUSOX|nr:hypothetical protein FOVG_16284 [Fusarium oxysporum f. sp. pisi HDV247]